MGGGSDHRGDGKCPGLGGQTQHCPQFSTIHSALVQHHGMKLVRGLAYCFKFTFSFRD